MSLGGIDLHFIHERGAGEDPLPILLLHGWPSSVWEFHKIIHLLTDAAGERGGFSVVVPSLPGYEFSFRPFQERFVLVECADALSELMSGALGYEEYVIVGGDWGAHIGTRMAHAHPDAVLGLHLNYSRCVVIPAGRSTPRRRRQPTCASLANGCTRRPGTRCCRARARRLRPTR